MTDQQIKGFQEVESQMFTFMKARQEAEKAGKKYFTCPLCGGEAWWERATINNHLRCRCNGCGISIMS